MSLSLRTDDPAYSIIGQRHIATSREVRLLRVNGLTRNQMWGKERDKNIGVHSGLHECHMLKLTFEPIKIDLTLKDAYAEWPCHRPESTGSLLR